MTVETRLIAPEYLSIYIAGRAGVDVPLETDRLGIFASQKCVNVPAYDWNRGDTNVTFGPFSEINNPNKPAFDGVVDTPSKRLVVYGALEPEYFSTPVPSTKTRIRIWMNDPIEPTNVVIAWE